MSKVANIKFNGGIIHTPSDVSPVDGDLNECINLVPSDGELKPLEMPEKTNITPFWTNEVLAAVHHINMNKYYVFAVYNGATSYIHIKDENNNAVFNHGITKEEIKWVETIGNTIVIGTDQDIHFALYKNGAYKWLGSSMPRPVIDFSLEYDRNLIISKDPSPTTLYQDSGETGGALYLSVPRDTVYSEIGLVPTPIVLLKFYLGRFNYSYHSDSNQTSSSGVRDNVLSKLAKITNEAKNKNQFIFPFLVRYALRLYDNSHVCLSQPILMLPSSSISPIFTTVNCYHAEQNMSSGNFTHYDLFCNIYMYGLPSRLKYDIKGFCDANNTIITNIDDWSDIIKGVDVFMSSQISPIDIDYISAARNWQMEYKGHGHDGYDSESYGKSYIGNDVQYLADQIENRIGSGPGGLVTHLFLKSKAWDAYYEELKNTNIFYLAKRFELENFGNTLGGEFFDEHVASGTLAKLETALTLKDEYLSRSKVGALASYVYNQRLIIGNLQVQAPLWYPTTESANINGSSDYPDYELSFKLEKQNKTIYVNASLNSASYRFGHYIFYPDTDCKTVVIKRIIQYNSIYGYKYVTLKMHEHPSLNGSIAILPDLEALNEYIKSHGTLNGVLPDASNDRYYRLSNNLFMSIIDNPFNYLADNMAEIGRMQIMGINSTPIPMSQGQFGQYPLIVFANDGVFALGIDDKGDFGGISLVSSADTVTHIKQLGRPNVISDGSSLYFITKRGLMEMRGLQVRCVSEVLNGGTWKYSDYRDCVNPNQGKVQYQNIVMLFGDGIKNSQTFNQAISNPDNPAFLAFDYKHNRILVTNPSLRAHWLYSITDHKWCKMIFNDNYKVDDKTAIQNISQMMSSGLINVKNPNDAVDGRDIVSAVFDWNASYLQTSDGELWDLMGAPDENDDAYYKYGFIASRPIRLGSDEHKSIIRLLHRERINSQYGFRGMRLYGSVDGIRFYEITSLRGASYKYFVVLLYTCMKANERYSYMSVEFEERFQNKLR